MGRMESGIILILLFREKMRFGYFWISLVHFNYQDALVVDILMV